MNLKQLKRILKEGIRDSKRMKQGLDDCSWGMEEGILISRRQAILLLDVVEIVLGIEVPAKPPSDTDGPIRISEALLTGETESDHE